MSTNGAMSIDCVPRRSAREDFVAATPQELEQPDARVITAAFYYDIGPGSEIAVEAAHLMLPRIAKLLE